MSHTLVRPEAGAVVEVHDLRGTGAHPTTPPVLHDPSGRRAARIRTGARAVLGLLLAWLAGLLLAGLGLLPANIIPFGFLVSAPAPPALVAMSGADHAADGRPGDTSAVGIVLGTAAAVSANDFKPLDARELRALGVSQRSLRPGVPAVDPRGSMSPAPGARGVPTQPVDAPRAGTHGPAGVAPGGDRPNAPSATEPAAAERPSSPAAPASNAGAGGNAADDRPAGNGSNGSGNANAGGGNANAGGGNANPNAGGGTTNPNAGGGNANAGGGNANAGNGNVNAGGGNANAGGGNANAGSGTTNPNAGGGNANAGGGNSAGGTGNAGSNAGGNTDANAAGSRGASSAGAGNGQSGNASSGDGSGGNGGAGKPRGRGADA